MKKFLNMFSSLAFLTALVVVPNCGIGTSPSGTQNIVCGIGTSPSGGVCK